MNIAEIKRKLIENEKKQQENEAEYNNIRTELEWEHEELKKKLQMEINNVNSERVDNAKRFIHVKGFEHYGSGETVMCVNDCIESLLTNPDRIKKEYFGCKNYSGFICQRSDHRYGYDPSHGSIVFSIGATRAYRCNEIEMSDKDLNDIIYTLENVKQKKITW